jgi:hypothetical protein
MRYFASVMVMLLACSISVVSAQSDFELPADVSLKSKDDYAKHENTFVGAARWLEETDLNVQEDKRQRLNAFVIQYLTGSPTVHVQISEAVTKLYGKNEQLLAIFLASYGRHVIENKGADNLMIIKGAITSMMNVYKKGINISKSKEMEKVMKLTDAALDDYIRKNFEL